jgi:hypothetical protein
METITDPITLGKFLETKIQTIDKVTIADVIKVEKSSDDLPIVDRPIHLLNQLQLKVHLSPLMILVYQREVKI